MSVQIEVVAGSQCLAVTSLKRWVLACLISLLCYAGIAPFADSSSAETLVDDQLRIVLNKDLSYFVEDSSLSVYEVHQKPDQDWVRFDGDINLGYTEETHWFKISINNQARQNLARVLEISYPLLDQVSVYLFTGNELTNSYATGDSLPFRHRPIEHRHFLFPLEFDAERDHSLYLRVQTAGALQVPLVLWEEREFRVADEKANAVNFLYFGILLIMAAFNLMLFFLIRDSSFISYVFFVSSIVVLMASTLGYAYQYVLSDYPRFHELSILLIVPIVQVSISIFTIQFLKLSDNSIFWYRLFVSFVIVGCLCMVGALVFPYNLSTKISVVFVLPVAIGAMAAGLMFWRSGSQSARLFSIAWVAILFCAASAVLNRLGLIPNFFFVDYGVQLSTTVQTLLFSLALAARFNSERDARMKAQQEYVEEIRKRRDVETQLVYAASHNEITGLPNRLLFEKSVRKYVDSCGDDNIELLVVLLHVRRFDDVNKTLGHRNADVLLRRIGERINSVVSESSNSLMMEQKQNDATYVAHIEGVSFCFCLVDAKKNEVMNYVDRLIKKMAEPVEFMGLALELSFLVGCSFNEEDVDPQTLLRQAFVAFDMAHNSLSPIAIYEPTMNPYSPKRLTLMTELRSALDHDGLELYFQPQINLENGCVSGFEALLRWTHHEFGFVPPDEFIPMAEKTGLMKPLTRWVLKRAAEFCKQLDDITCDAFVSVNISALNLREPSFSEQVCDVLAALEASPQRMVLEVTETAAMIDPESALTVLRDLNTAGVRLSIDDFGTGHSSLSYIRRLPVQEIKIDRSFISEMDKNKGDATIVRTTINMCHDLGFEVVAEGVENQETLEMLKDMDCDVIQGYHIARPMSLADTVSWLTETEWKLTRPEKS
ncbi:MAG: EAL domain-containing protein [Agarilytica sp.]